MRNCIKLITEDNTPYHNDVFDHPTYRHTCKRTGKEVIPFIHCHLGTQTISFPYLIIGIFLNTVTTKVMDVVYIFRDVITGIRISLHCRADIISIRKIN